MDQTLPSWFWASFPAFFVATWLGVCHLLSSMGGWRALAESYPAHAAPSGERFRMRSGQLRRWVNYNGCLNFVAAPGGLHISLLFFFRFGHPSILIPWPEIRAEAGRAWLVPVVTLYFAKQPSVSLRVRRNLAELLIRAGGGQVRLEEAG